MRFLRESEVSRRWGGAALWLATAFFVAVGSGLGCHRRPPGTCQRDIDCPPTFDCKAGRCEARVRWQPRAENAVSRAVTPASPAAPPPGPPPAPLRAPPPQAPRDAGTGRPEAPTPIVLPAATEPTGRVPLWQQRRKNF